MRTFTSVALPLCLSTSFALAEPAERVFTPSQAEMAIIQDALSKRMLDPNSTIVSNVVAARETIGGDQMTWVCGNVRGRNSMGGYSQDTPFMGALVEASTGASEFMVIAVSGQDAAEQHRVLTECLGRLE